MSAEKSTDTFNHFLKDISQFASEKAEQAPGTRHEVEGVGRPTSVGHRVHRVRKEKGLSVEDVAQRTGLSSEYLVRIETNEVSPPLGALIRVSKALDMKLGRFISTGEVKPFTVVRKDQRRVVSRYTSAQGDRYGYTYESLAAEKKDRYMEPFMVTLVPSEARKELSTHVGQEFIYVLEGAMEVTLKDYTEVLYPGDSIYYDSTVPHLVRCHGEKEAVILAVLYIEEE